MTFGFRVINDAGSQQIDDTYSNLAFISKTTFSTAIDSFGRNWHEFSFTSTSTFPLVAFRCTTVSVGVAWYTVSGTTWTYRVYADGSSPVSITAYVFDRPPTPDKSGFGMLIFDGSSKQTYDNRQEYLTIVDEVSGSMSATHTYISGRSYAFIPAQAGLRSAVTQVPNSSPIVYITLYFIQTSARISDPSVIVSGDTINVASSSGNGGIHGHGSNIYVVDVTGL